MRSIALYFLLLFQASSLVGQGKKQLNESKFQQLQDAYYEGIRQGALGNEQKAEREFRSCLILDPAHHASMYMLANISRHRRDLRQADYWLSKAIHLDDKNRWYFELQAEVQKLKHEFSAAGDTYFKIYKLDPSNNEYLDDAGAMYSIGGDNYHAIKIYNILEKKNGINEEYSLAKENVFLQAHRATKALAEINKLSSTFPENLRYKGMVADLYMNKGKEKYALKIYTDILGKDPQNGYAHFAMSDYYYRRKEEIASTEEMKKALHDSRIDIKLKMTAILERYPNTMGNKAALIDMAIMGKIMITAHPNDADAYRFYADVLMQSEKYDTARDIYEESLNHNNSSFEVYVRLCDLDLKLNEIEKLATHSAKGLELFPNISVFYFFNMTANYRLKKYEAAVNCAMAGLETAPVDPEISIRLLAGLGDAANFTKKYTLSDSAYKQALLLDSNDTYVLNNWAYFLSLRNTQLAKAEQMGKKIVTLEPDNANYDDTYGWVLYKLGNYAEALEHVKKAAHTSPNNAEVLEHLGDIHYKLGSHNEALESWQKAKEAGSGYSEFLLKKIKLKTMVE